MTSNPSDKTRTVPSSRPGAVLFVCNRNSIRSPMAEAIAKYLQSGRPGSRTFIDSAGIDPDEVNGFAIRALNDWDLHLERHVAKSLDDINFGEFDLVVSLAEPARQYLDQHCDLGGAQHVFWDVEDPLPPGSALSAAALPAFQRVRDDLKQRIAALLHL